MVPMLSPENDRPRLGCALAIVAKLPHAGACKTRLVPPLDLEQAAALSRCFISDTMRNIVLATTHHRAHAAALYTPAADERSLREAFGEAAAYVVQRGGDLGERLSSGIDDLFGLGYESVCVIDSDSPTVPTIFLEHAIRALEEPGDRVVLGPAADGGYYLLGVKRRHPELFERVTWSTSRVYEQTVARAAAAGLEVESLPRWYDVDDGAALALLTREFETGEPSGGFFAPATRAFMSGGAHRRVRPAFAAAEAG